MRKLVRWGRGGTLWPTALEGIFVNIKYPPAFKTINNSILVKKVLFFSLFFLSVLLYLEAESRFQNEKRVHVEMLKTMLK